VAGALSELPMVVGSDTRQQRGNDRQEGITGGGFPYLLFLFSRMQVYLFSLRSYVLDSRGGEESAEKTPEINLRVSASPRGNEAFKPSRV